MSVTVSIAPEKPKGPRCYQFIEAGAKYRILKVGRWYYPQYRHWLFWWKSYLFHGFGQETASFDDYSEAVEWTEKAISREKRKPEKTVVWESR
jgi:hypothetical protein